MDAKTALIIVDMQNDFVEEGKLAVTGGKELSEKISKYIDEHGQWYDILATSQDWHISAPEHFEQWPEHCVAETEGADIVPEVRQALESRMFDTMQVRAYKGMYDHGYSAYDGLTLGERLADRLNLYGIEHVVICGIATDHCVRATAVDFSVDTRYKSVTVLEDLCLGIDPDGTSEFLLTEAPGLGIVVNTTA